jgi:hypothetical protein
MDRARWRAAWEQWADYKAFTWNMWKKSGTTAAKASEFDPTAFLDAAPREAQPDEKPIAMVPITALRDVFIRKQMPQISEEGQSD